MTAPRFLSPSRETFLLCLFATVMCLCAAGILYARHPPELLDTANKLGPAAESLVLGRGLAICYGSVDAPNCFHAQRMPIAPLTLALLYLLLKNHGVVAALVKTLLCLLPALLLFLLIARQARCASRRRQASAFLLLLFTMALPPMLDLAANLNFEEAYCYGWLTLGAGLLMFPEFSCKRPRLWALLLSSCVTALYFTKSSLLLVAAFLTGMAVFYAFRHLRRKSTAFALVCIFVSAPLVWGTWQHHASGRFTAGTSLDGVNLYKGNNPLFLRHYPLFTGASVDQDEAALFAGHVSDTEEWDENDFGVASACSYMRTHVAETAEAAFRKMTVFFLGVRRNAVDVSYSPGLEFVFTAGLAVFRLMMFLALALALWQVSHRGSNRFPGTVFLGVVVCVAVPYVLGFALTRHATILILPTAAYLCSFILKTRHLPENCAIPVAK